MPPTPTPPHPTADRPGDARPTSRGRRRLGTAATSAAACVIALALVAGCGSSGSRSGAPAGGTSAGPASTSTVTDGGSGTATTLATNGPGDTLPSGTATIDHARTPLGDILTDGRGFTLYASNAESGSSTSCLDVCTSVWIPAVGTTVGVAGGIPRQTARFQLIPRPDGSSQVVVNGHRLYRYSGDTTPGEVKGQGVNGQWHVVGLEGEPITG